MKVFTSNANPVAIVMGASIALIIFISLSQVNRDIEEIEQEVAVERVIQSIMPDFAAIKDTKLKKESFFSFVEGFIDVENDRMLLIRNKLLELSQLTENGMKLSAAERLLLDEIADEFRLGKTKLSEADLVYELTLRVDVLPKSLVLAQAANESAWGTSRFALEGNNIFGQWCFTEGCGLIPRARSKNATHEVRSFSSIQGSVHAYFLNLNTNPNYQYLRELRWNMRRRNERLDSITLAMGLSRYAETRFNYVDLVQNIIVQNKLTERDRPLHTSL